MKLFGRIAGKDKEGIFYFIKDFRIPFTSNNAKSAQRGVKIKQKVGKFSPLAGADNYCKIKSFVLIPKERKIFIIESIKAILENQPVLE